MFCFAVVLSRLTINVIGTFNCSAADNTITKEEAKKIRARWEELKSVTEGFVKAAEAGTFGLPKEVTAKQ